MDEATTRRNYSLTSHCFSLLYVLNANNSNAAKLKLDQTLLTQTRNMHAKQIHKVLLVISVSLTLLLSQSRNMHANKHKCSSLRSLGFFFRDRHRLRSIGIDYHRFFHDFTRFRSREIRDVVATTSDVRGRWNGSLRMTLHRGVRGAAGGGRRETPCILPRRRRRRRGSGAAGTKFSESSHPTRFTHVVVNSTCNSTKDEKEHNNHNRRDRSTAESIITAAAAETGAFPTVVGDAV